MKEEYQNWLIAKYERRRHVSTVWKQTPPVEAVPKQMVITVNTHLICSNSSTNKNGQNQQEAGGHKIPKPRPKA